MKPRMGRRKGPLERPRMSPRRFGWTWRYERTADGRVLSLLILLGHKHRAPQKRQQEAASALRPRLASGSLMSRLHTAAGSVLLPRACESAADLAISSSSFPARAELGDPRVVGDPNHNRAGALDHRQHLPADRSRQRLIAPRRQGHEGMQRLPRRLHTVRPAPSSHPFDAFAPDQTAAVPGRNSRAAVKQR